MTVRRRPLTRDELAPLARAALGPARTLTAVTRLRGGSKKGAYRLFLDDGSTAVAYVWDPAEDYWDAAPADPRDSFSHASGLDLFTAAYDRLTALGIRTPRLLFADRGHTHLPSDVAVVEDVRGGSLEDLLHRDPEAAEGPLRELAEALRTLHAHSAPRHGKVAVVDNGGSAYGGSCEQVVLERALADLAEAAARDARIAAVREALHDRLHALAGRVRPRGRVGLVHGELGPDHVLVDEHGHPALIDIEGLLYFDAEWEHVFLRQRFHDDYAALRAEGLDEDRLRLYRLAMHLSLVAGPLRLLDGDFPDPEFMRAIAEHSVGQTLTLLEHPVP
ncbi:phosphotransferase family protein [Streptomyces olivochromogenes]|uniref:Aminoglycoside phosphotransferase n=1 Tax=Streptomyces olivochromogenes TaxID=1963 RepID=A0A250VAI0_STROL|nr:phosphotransferase [Streptomyces olivochromogenes]KUN46227.1 aminoglycoside phosphotransferase [Streptomyces olivochromogenes]GAX51104.1 aminoglycoside phosphotransferase [Streptomyces olivochromogenes]